MVRKAQQLQNSHSFELAWLARLSLLALLALLLSLLILRLRRRLLHRDHMHPLPVSYLLLLLERLRSARLALPRLLLLPCLLLALLLILRLTLLPRLLVLLHVLGV